MLGSTLGAAYKVTLGVSDASELGSSDGFSDGSNDGKHVVLLLVVSLE